MELSSTSFVEDDGRTSEEEKEDEKDKQDVPCREGPCDQDKHRAWAPSFFYTMDQERYHFVEQDIVIQEALDSYAGQIWPAAPALCQYLESHHKELNLADKAVLEIGSGTGLVAVVAALLGAWVTATDLPDVLSNLRLNLSRNTRGKCRHTPQVAALSWSYDLEHTYPSSVYHYDYVLAADVVYHHDFLDELLATMKHFCQPGTTLIWANKVRMVTDIEFCEKFKKAFHTTLLVEDGDMKIITATYRDDKEEGDMELQVQDVPAENTQEGKGKQRYELHEMEKDEELGIKNEAEEEVVSSDKERESSKSEKTEEDKEDEEDEHKTEESAITPDPASREDTSGQDNAKKITWTPSVLGTHGKDLYHYVGKDIVIYESIDYYGSVMWPAALALCSFLENNKETVNLEGKLVLELGAGTGLVAIVASLLGAAVTATDIPEILGNLRANVMRNTRGRCRYTPQIGPLSWSYDIGRIYPASVYRYDYVLAADVVYHHKFLDELMFTMKHFCHKGTTVIWANKFRLEADAEFIEKFKKEFHTTLLAEDETIKIFMGTLNKNE